MTESLTSLHDTSAAPLIEQCLGEVVDAKGKTLTVWMCEQICGSRAFALFLKTYAEIIEKNYSPAYVGWESINKINVVYLYDEESQQVAGGIAFEYRHFNREGWIVLSFTSPKYRGRNINQLAHVYFEGNIRARGGNRIGSHVHVNNHSRLRAIEKVGMKAECYRMSKWLT